DAPALAIAEGEPAVEVERGELTVVVEHLLEVRHEPVRVHGVAVEATADLVVDPAARHHRQRRVDHLAGPRVLRAPPEAQDELPDHRLGKLRRAPEPALPLVELGRERLEGAEQDLVGEELGRARSRSAWVSASPIWRAEAVTSPRRFAHASASAWRSRGNPGRPCRSTGGK